MRVRASRLVALQRSSERRIVALPAPAQPRRRPDRPRLRFPRSAAHRPSAHVQARRPRPCLCLLGRVAAAARTTHGRAAAAPATVRVRGVIEHVDAHSLTVKDRSGEVVTMARPRRHARHRGAARSRWRDIKPDSYVGAGAMPQPDGTQRARRGAGVSRSHARHRRGLPPLGLHAQQHHDQRHRLPTLSAAPASARGRPEAAAQVQGRRADRDRAAAARRS